MNDRYSWAAVGLLIGGCCLWACLVPMLIGSPIGRIQFTPLASGQGRQTIQGTDFAVERRADGGRLSVFLIDLSSGEEHRLLTTLFESSVAVVPWNGKVFLINEAWGGGTNGWTYYTVVDVSGVEPERRGVFQGCRAPRHILNSLVFDYSSKCDTYPYLRAIQFETFSLE